MAAILADVGNVKLIKQSASNNEKEAFNPMPNSSLNSEKLQSLGWQGLFDAFTGLSHTVKILSGVNSDA